MFEWIIGSDNDAIAMLKKDHERVKDLFERFEKADRKAERRKTAALALDELRLHALLEEEIFYPAVREKLGQRDSGIMNEADEEHHVAKLLIAEIAAMDPESDRFQAKFTVLAENVRHHIKEEESHMLPKANGLEIDFKALGRRMALRKKEAKADGLPKTSEDKLVATSGPVDSPAKAAHAKRRTATPRRRTTGKAAPSAAR